MVHASGSHDVDVVFAPLDDDGQCCGASIGNAADVVGHLAGIRVVRSVVGKSVVQTNVVGTMLGPVGSVSEVIADSWGGHGEAWLALNGFNAN